MARKILILSAGFGEGHNAAARGLHDALEQIAPETEPTLIDLFELAYGRSNEIARKAYLATINQAPRIWEAIYKFVDSTSWAQQYIAHLGGARDKLLKLLDEHQPAAVVSAYPAYAYLFDSQERERRSCPLITIVTDSLTVNSIWYRAPSDHFVVPNEPTGAVLTEAGIAGEKIHVLGFPVSPIFANQAPARPDPSAQKSRVLYMINSGKKEAPDLVRRLLELPAIELTVTAGRDTELLKRVQDVANESRKPMELYGWTDQLPLLLMRSHLLISKAGGATVQETIAARTPMIISQVVPGQEEGNARLITESGCGRVSETHEEIVGAVEEAFRDDAKLWREWEKNLRILSRPTAALDVARFVLKIVDRGG